MDRILCTNVVRNCRGVVSWRLACLLAVVAWGLASRRYPFLFPAAWGKYPGDALWALMVYVGLGVLQPGAAIAKRGLLAMAFASLVEFSQLVHTPWLDAWRATPLGHLVLGRAFAWHDILAYAVGIVVGMGVESGLARRIPRR